MDSETIVRLYHKAKFYTPYGVGTLWTFNTSVGGVDFNVETDKGRKLMTMPANVVKPILKRFDDMKRHDRDELYHNTGFKVIPGKSFATCCKETTYDAIIRAATWLRDNSIDVDDLYEKELSIDAKEYTRDISHLLDLDAIMDDEEQVYAIYDLFEPFIPDNYANFLIEIGWYTSLRVMEKRLPDQVSSEMVSELIQEFLNYFPVRRKVIGPGGLLKLKHKYVPGDSFIKQWRDQVAVSKEKDAKTVDITPAPEKDKPTDNDGNEIS